MDTKDRNEWRSEQDQSKESYHTSSGVTRNSDQIPARISANMREIPNNSGRISGATTNTTSAGSGAMTGSSSGISRDYEPGRGYGQAEEGRRSNRDQGESVRRGAPQNQRPDYGNDRPASQYSGQQSPENTRESNYYGGGQANATGSNPGRSGHQPWEGSRQHRANYHQYQGGQGGHDYGQTSDWNQSHGSNWENQNRNQQNQQRGSRGRSGYRQNADFSRTGTTPSSYNRFEEQNQYSREGSQNRNYDHLNRDRGYRNQPYHGSNSAAGYETGNYGSDRNRDLGRGKRESYGGGEDRGRNMSGGPNRSSFSSYKGYGGNNDFSGGAYGSNDLGGGPYIGEGYEPPKNYGGSINYGREPNRGGDFERGHDYRGGYNRQNRYGSSQSYESSNSPYGGSSVPERDYESRNYGRTSYNPNQNKRGGSSNYGDYHRDRNRNYGTDYSRGSGNYSGSSSNRGDNYDEG